MGICIGFYDEDAKECKKCREKVTCEYIKNDPEVSVEVGKITKKNRKIINSILKEYKNNYGHNLKK
jgi:hypothetical protein